MFPIGYGLTVSNKLHTACFSSEGVFPHSWRLINLGFNHPSFINKKIFSIVIAILMKKSE